MTPGPELMSLGEEIAKWVGGAIVGKEVVRTLLTPSAEYVAANLRSVLERVGNVNVGRIFGRYLYLTGNTPNADDKTVHPRVVQRVLEDGSLSDDPLTQEYFARLLFASRDLDPDDRAISMLAVIRNLGSGEIWLHAALYRTWLNLFGGSLYTMAESHVEALTVRLGTNSEQGHRMDAAIGLATAGLIQIEAQFHGQLLVRPSVSGARLFMWIIGRGHENVNRFFRTSEALAVSDLPCFVQEPFFERLSAFRLNTLSNVSKLIMLNDRTHRTEFMLALDLQQVSCAVWPLSSFTLENYLMDTEIATHKLRLCCDRAQLLIMSANKVRCAVAEAGTSIYGCESCQRQLHVPSEWSERTLLQWDSDYHGECADGRKHDWSLAW